MLEPVTLVFGYLNSPNAEVGVGTVCVGVGAVCCWVGEGSSFYKFI